MPIPADNLVIFIVSALVLLVTPGPAVLYIVARSLEHGRAAGMASVLGVGVGGLIHVVAAILGLSAILATSPVLYRVIAFGGAGYLMWLGITSLRRAGRDHGVQPVAPRDLKRVFTDGIVVNVLNPKAALFFLAFLPQFVDPSRGGVATQLGFLGGIFLSLAVVTDLGYVLLAASIDRAFRGRAVLKTQRVVSGVVYLLLGLVAAVAGRSG